MVHPTKTCYSMNELIRESLARRVHILPHWDQNKLDIMRELLKQKFTHDSEFGMRLIATGDAKLVENTSHPFWGIGKYNQGENWLGRLLMEIRDDLSPKPI